MIGLSSVFNGLMRSYTSSIQMSDNVNGNYQLSAIEEYFNNRHTISGVESRGSCFTGHSKLHYILRVHLIAHLNYLVSCGFTKIPWSAQ